MKKLILVFLAASALAKDTCRVSYKWEGPAGFSSTNESIAVTARVGASGTYSVIVSDAFSCESTSAVQLVVLPVLTCYLTPDPALVASGETLDFTINPEGGTPPFQFIWWGPAGFTSTNQTTTVSVEGFYIGSATDSKGCNNSDSVFLQVIR